MDNWTEKYITLLASKKAGISDSDFRFYNIGRLPLLAEKTRSCAVECSICRSHLHTLVEITKQLPECLLATRSRKAFEKHRYAIEQHLRKAHKVRHAHFYYALYSFWGAAIGAVVGLLIGFLLRNSLNLNLILIGFAFGLLIGQILGKRADKHNYARKLQI